MAIVQLQVSYCSELAALIDVIYSLASDAVAKAPAAQIVSDAIPKLTAALTGLSQVSADVANTGALDNTVALELVKFKQLLLPKLP